MAKPLLTRVLEAFGKSPDDDKAPEGVCGPCWGYSEYAGKIRKELAHKRVSPDSADGRWVIEDFVVKHITGIELEPTSSGSGRCPRCGKLTH